MKVHIAYPFREEAFGGANQFLKGLRDHLAARRSYSDQIGAADVVLVNANPDSFTMKRLWAAVAGRSPQGSLVLRLDGVVSSYRPADWGFDRFVVGILAPNCQGLVFQSEWGKEQLHRFGLAPHAHEAVITNAPDPTIFFPATEEDRQGGKIRLIASSWSPNPRKGFGSLKYLDAHLDWSRYAMYFVGNTPEVFENIRCHPAMDSKRLASLLRKQDIFFFAAEGDTCSNSLIEAMHCGLVPVALNSGGSAELIGDRGVLFDDDSEAIRAIEKASQSLAVFRAQNRPVSINDVAERYLCFLEIVHSSATEHRKRRWVTDLTLLVANAIRIARRSFDAAWQRRSP
jgi:glycosyltransferase involved in cell wall biosynthesis